ncbi:hypothetical protein HYV10_02965 [Candidatus Dependentiae bacterium]|nr:hypothetical protein [Candidatus Dependentiae bacterium]
MILPQNESGIWKWSPFRIGSHMIWGQRLGQDFWETNASELKSQLNNFKSAKTNEDKVRILQDVMTKSADAYQNVIEGFKNNYRTTMSYIIEQFQNESPDSTILYLPDNKLVTMYRKDVPDEEKTKLMYNLLRKADEINAKKRTTILPTNTPQTVLTPGYHVYPINPITS